MTLPICACLECENRYLGCHKKCEAYAEYRAQIDAAKQAAAAEILNANYVNESKRRAEKRVHDYSARNSDRRYR